jgi:hypothetical protein
VPEPHDPEANDGHFVPLTHARVSLMPRWNRDGEHKARGGSIRRKPRCGGRPDTGTDAIRCDVTEPLAVPNQAG